MYNSEVPNWYFNITVFFQSLWELLHTKIFWSRDSSVGVATGYGLNGPGIESRWGSRFAEPVQAGPGANTVSDTMSTGSFQGVKQPGGGFDHPRASSAEVKERVELYLYSPSWPSWSFLGWNVLRSFRRLKVLDGSSYRTLQLVQWQSYLLDIGGILVRLPTRDLSRLHNVQRGTEALTTHYSVRNRDFFRGSKTAGAWSCHPI